jgi:peptide/nickel transport system permease protein
MRILDVLLAIAIVSIPAYARVMRASVLSVKEYTVAARTVGVSAPQILFRLLGDGLRDALDPRLRR